jgi:hypothetical protein
MVDAIRPGMLIAILWAGGIEITRDEDLVRNVVVGPFPFPPLGYLSISGW